MRLRAFVLIAALSPTQVLGQGTVSGTVTNSSLDPLRGLTVLPGVTVTITDVTADADAGPQRTIVTDASGQYAFGNLCPGSYVVTFRLPGFRSVLQRDLAVKSGASVGVSVALQPGSGLAPFWTHLSIPGVQANTSPIIEERTIPAALPAVWAAWTTDEGLRSWLAPHASIDLRIGGLMRTNGNAQGTLGDDQTIENVVLSFEPERMLSFRVAKAPTDRRFPNTIGEMWTVLHFESVDVDRTKVRIVGMGFTESRESQRMRVFFEQSNATTLDLLERRFLSCGP